MIFAGCDMYRKCFNDIYIMNVNDPCPLNCSNQGSCKPGLGCVCKPPFIKNDCSLKIQCHQDCTGHGQCNSNGKCGCFAGWSGIVCDAPVNCLHNCTSEMNGICQTDATCKCNPGYSGAYCQEKAGQKDNDLLKSIINKNQNQLNKQEMKLSNRSEISC